MPNTSTRRTFLLTLASIPFLLNSPARAKETNKTQSAQTSFQKLERKFGGRLGVFVLNTANNEELSYRANERFPVCSTFKALAAGAILSRSNHIQGLLQKRIKYQPNQLVAHSPITEKHLKDGMTVADLCAAAIQYSDNTAGNLLLQILGGPQALTAFTRSIDDTKFRLDRWETALNTAIPGDERDTSTPAAMGRSLNHLALGDALKPQQRQQLQNWLLGNTTGATRINAGLPASWKIGDKTGTGDFGTANDLAILWPPQGKPVIVAIYSTQPHKTAPARSDVIAAASRIVVDWLR